MKVKKKNWKKSFFFFKFKLIWKYFSFKILFPINFIQNFILSQLYVIILN